MQQQGNTSFDTLALTLTLSFSNKDRKNFMVIARCCAFGCAIIEYLYELSEIDKDYYSNFVNNLEEISKMPMV